MVLLLICRHIYFCVSLTRFQTSLLSVDLFFSYCVSALLTPFRHGSAQGSFRNAQGPVAALGVFWEILVLARPREQPAWKQQGLGQPQRSGLRGR